MRRALVLNAVDPRIGGVLIRGERGLLNLRLPALAALLPRVAVCTIACFGCDPDRPLPVYRMPERLRVRITSCTTSHHCFCKPAISATEDRVVGTLDIEQAIQKEKGVSSHARIGRADNRFALTSMKSIY
jgi:Mg-chelatase subunit ChlI